MRISDWSSDVCSSDLQHYFGFGIVPGRIGSHAYLGATTHGRQNGGFGENLRIGTDRDLEILRPHAVVDQRLLERRGVTAARHHRSDRAADTLLEPPAPLGRLAGVAARALLAHAFDRRDSEGVARSLDSLENRRANA